MVAFWGLEVGGIVKSPFSVIPKAGILKRFKTLVTFYEFIRQDRVELTGLHPLALPHHRTCGFPHPAVESSGFRFLRKLPRQNEAVLC
jgi:hypothetical protein